MLLSRTSPERSRKLKLPDFMTIGTHTWQGCQPYAPAAFTPQEIFLVLISVVGRDSLACIATRNGLDGPGIGSRWRRYIFRIRPDQTWGPPGLIYSGYRVFPRGKSAGA
jgi:hypothetical protein